MIGKLLAQYHLLVKLIGWSHRTLLSKPSAEGLLHLGPAVPEPTAKRYTPNLRPFFLDLEAITNAIFRELTL
jgi:hypothetical protein